MTHAKLTTLDVGRAFAHGSLVGAVATVSVLAAAIPLVDVGAGAAAAFGVAPLLFVVTDKGSADFFAGVARSGSDGVEIENAANVAALGVNGANAE